MINSNQHSNLRVSDFNNEYPDQGDLQEFEKRLAAELEILKKTLKDLDVFVVNTSTRPKEFESALTKTLKSGKELSELWDLVAGRVVLLNLQDVALAARFLTHSLWKDHPELEIKNVEDFYASPKGGVYRGVHLDITFKKTPSFKCEVQLRTLLDDAWAEWEHQVEYKVGGASLSAVEQEFIKAIAVHFDSLNMSTHDLRETVSARKALADSVTLMPRFAPKDLPESAEVREYFKCIAPITNETTLEFVSLEGCDQSQVRTSLSNDHCGIPARDGVPDPDYFWRLPHSLLRDAPDTLQARLDATLATLREPFQKYLELCFELSKTANRPFDNHPCAKLLRSRGIEDGKERSLTIDLVQTSYYTHACTNRMLSDTEPAIWDPCGTTAAKMGEIQTHLKGLVDKGDGVLRAICADPLSIHVVLIGRNVDGLETLITLRSDRNLESQRLWNSSASGYIIPRRSTLLVGGDIPGFEFMNRTKRFQSESAEATSGPIYASSTPQLSSGQMQKGDTVDLFMAARRKLWEDLALNIPVHHMRLTALCYIKSSQHPHVIVEAFVDRALAEVEDKLQWAVRCWKRNEHKSIPLTSDMFRSLLEGERERKPLIGSNTGDNDVKGWTAVGRMAVLLAFVRHVPSAWHELQKRFPNASAIR